MNQKGIILVIIRFLGKVLLVDSLIFLLTWPFCWYRFRGDLTAHQFGMSLSTTSFLFIIIGLGFFVITNTTSNMVPGLLRLRPQLKSKAEREQDEKQREWGWKTALVLITAGIVAIVLAEIFFLA